MMTYPVKAKIKHILLNIICLTSVCLSFFLTSSCICMPAHCGAKQHISILSSEDSNKMVADENNIENTSTPTPDNNNSDNVGSLLVENTNNLVALGTVILCILSFGVGVIVSHKLKLERK